MKRYRWSGAGLMFVYGLFLSYSLLAARFFVDSSNRSLNFDIFSGSAVFAILVSIAAISLWVSYLRYFAKTRLEHIEQKAVLVLHSLGLGFGIFGIVAWLRWMLTGNPNTTLLGVTFASAMVFQLAAWTIESSQLRLDRSTLETSGTYPGGWRDYVMLTKPIVLALLLVTTLAAMIVAAGRMPAPGLILWTMVGGAFSAGGASALNQYIDRVRDGKMSRTKRRPLPEGRLHPNNVISFGTLLCVGGFYTLAIFVNLLSALLALAGMVYYVVFYSLVLKPTTTQNIVIGGGAGAIPPLVGWAAATGELSMPAFFLFALVFFWTPPHFWALALLKRRDYARAGVPMLPVIHGPHETRWQIMLYTVQVVALTLLLPLAKLGGQIYLLAAVLLGGGLVFYAWRLWREGGNQPAYKMYRYSSTYLALIFAALVVDTFI